MNRRQFLGGSGTVAMVGITGCSTLDSGGREGVILTQVELGNATGEPQAFDVVVTYDGDLTHWSSYEVEVGDAEQEMGGEVVEIDAPDNPGAVEVHVRVGETWKSVDFDADRYDGERVIAIATYGWPDETLRISRVIDGRPTPANER